MNCLMSSSFETSFKDKRSLIYEILFSLEAIVGDLVAIDANRDSKTLHLNELTSKSSLSLSEINLIKQLLQIANHYNRVNHFVQKYSSDSNSYNRRLAQSIDELLIDYRNDLIEVEKDINRDSEYCLIKFTKFFKFSHTFEFLNQIVSQFNDEMYSYGSALDLLNKNLFSGFSRIQSSAKTIQKSSECLYSDIWSWIFFGFLSKRSQNNFFIEESTDCQKLRLEVSRIPPFLDPSEAFKILKIGEIVRWSQSRGVSVKSLFGDKEKQILEYLSHLEDRQLADKNSFTDLLEFVRKIVSEHNWNYVVNEQPFKECFIDIKNIYLTSSDNFWSIFVSNSSKLLTNGHKSSQRELENIFEFSMRQVFTDNEVNQLLSHFSINTPKNGNNISFFINYEIPVSLQNIITNDSLDKYNKITNFMAKLYFSRFELNEIWINSVKIESNPKSNLKIKVLVLRHSLSFLINCFYNYFKTDVIEKLFSNFMERIDRTKDMEIIQKEHQILLTHIIAQMFLKTPVINNCLEQIFLLCTQFKRCLDSENSMNRLIEDFERTKGQTYHLLVNFEAYKTNKTISNLVSEIEKLQNNKYF